MKNDSFYIEHILNAISKIDDYISNVNFKKFQEKSIIHDAVIRQLEIIGEATKNLSEDFTKKHNNIPWRYMAGMRDKLIHQYFDVDFNLIWKTLETDIPSLKKYIKENII